MRRTSTWLAFATFVIVVGAFFHITNVHATPATGFVARGSDGFRREVIAGEATPRKVSRHQIDGVAGPTADVEHVEPRCQTVHETRDGGQGTIKQGLIKGLT